MNIEQQSRLSAALLIEMYGTDISGKWMRVDVVMTMLSDLLGEAAKSVENESSLIQSQDC